jgi:L-serine dehydratase
MVAARLFAEALRSSQRLHWVSRIRADLYGSLGATGRGHGSDKAVILGLEGEAPEGIDPDVIDARLGQVRSEKSIRLLGEHRIAFEEREDLIFHRKESLPFHPNGMRFSAQDGAGRELVAREYYSIGGGFVVDESAAGAVRIQADTRRLPYAFHTGAELLHVCRTHGTSVARVMLDNESAWRPEEETRAGLLAIWHAMQRCVERGCSREGVLPGGIRIARRAPQLHRKLSEMQDASPHDPLAVLDWVSLFAMAVNEENAAGGRVVTAPTNGAAGIIPAVLHYYVRFVDKADDEGVIDFLLTAGAIGLLYKENASISGAEVGCQGEVGVACSMAAGALAAVQGGSPEQVENAAEIGMEHNLGLTCDPVGGLVQVPCIERNAMGAVKAINAARMALHGDGKHFVSLDKVIRTMLQTGEDMKDKYKETSRGGLAVNVIEC